jgi:hypothetical protein
VIVQLFAFFDLGWSTQTWAVNSLSRCNSKFFLISSKDLPSGAPEGLKTQGHSEHPKPPKRFFSIHMSLRSGAIEAGKRFSVPILYHFCFTSSSLQPHARFL